MELNNRELATLILLGAFTVLVVAVPAARPQIRAIMRQLISPKVATPFLVLAGWVAGLAALGHALGIWDQRLLAATIFWTVAQGAVLVVRVITRDTKAPFYRPAMRRAFELSVFLEAIVGLFAFSVPIELGLGVAAVVFAVVSAAPAAQPGAAQVQRAARLLLALMAVVVVSHAIGHLAGHWRHVSKAQLGRALLLPPYLTLAVLPCLFVMDLWSGYELAFIRLDFATDGLRLRRRSKLGLVLSLRGRPALVRAFTGSWAREAAQASTVGGAFTIGRAFRDAEQRRADQIRAAEDRSDRYVGVDGVDEDGRRLDRREFAETRKALQWLGTGQNGWYQQDGCYRADLIDVLRFDDLPDDHGIKLHVAADGQAWWAWRRTVSGWCFAIGATGPPPDQWLYDGAEPPTGIPSEDDAWSWLGAGAVNW